MRLFIKFTHFLDIPSSFYVNKNILRTKSLDIYGFNSFFYLFMISIMNKIRSYITNRQKNIGFYENFV